MKKTNKFGVVLGVMAALALAGCANTNGANYPSNPNVANANNPNNASNTYSMYGVVHSIELVQQENTGAAGSSIGLGTIAGAVIGGVLGNQVGGGTGKTVATVAGAAGGAYVGHELENKQPQTVDAYRIIARMDNGTYQSTMQSTDSGFRVGDRVRIENGIMQRY
jgi:outer membrane lipoprotein SlyB